jgi:WD40 repeat protein
VGGDGAINLWEVKSGKQVGQTLTQTGWIKGVALSPDGQTLASAGEDKMIRLWKVASGELIDQLEGHTEAIHALAFSPDGKILASGSDDTTIILWNVATRQPLGPPLNASGQDDTISSVAFSPDGALLATASDDNKVILWNVQAGRQLGQPLGDHGSWVGSVAFSPDGRLLASAGGDKRIILWNVATRQPLEPPLSGHTAAIQDLTFSPDGQALISIAEDGAIIRWDMSLASWQARACQVAGRNLTWTEWQQYLGDQPYRLTCPDAPLGLVELFNRGDALAQAGQKQPAAQAFEQAVKLAQETNSDVLNNQLCWFGSLDGLAEVVLPACERAIELAPDDKIGFYRDSRGLAFALLKEYDQAIADFEAFVKWSKERNLYERLRLKREEWIKELKAGRNPFDAELLTALRNEG